ncbi:hypothetical protein, partial [Seohaeicola sp. 4SK31]|uniref:hypothetical protein n=1 Tax=Seohaeicola sp. 4SK31 TaxID=3028386 RepID=UPI00237A0B9F
LPLLSPKFAALCLSKNSITSCRQTGRLPNQSAFRINHFTRDASVPFQGLIADGERREYKLINLDRRQHELALLRRPSLGGELVWPDEPRDPRHICRHPLELGRHAGQGCLPLQ